MKALFDQSSFQCSKLITQKYSTSFSLGIKMLQKSIHDPIYAIYGFVRLADEIVDSFHEYDKQKLLDDFEKQTYEAIEYKISTNPILNCFQQTVNQYNIDLQLIDCFLKSMKMDLQQIEYNEYKYKEYILGSAEVVGLMCLKVFCDGNQEQYEKLKPSAMSLGAAFQKVNFLRDMQEDYKTLGRTYFPNVNFSNFDQNAKLEIEKDIIKDFEDAYKGIKQLPNSSRFGVYTAYMYYYLLFKKIQKTHHSQIMNKRIRISNGTKYSLALVSYFRYSVNLL